ncbi:succinylglutamate desuccinylase/aspartoacylase family protein [Olleya sp. YS]|uniref:succinylglutamate desuccinylase/aspartoacylase family protein n=1 Tax=Olleya sp. YS TaxID=3028318 RepID=UPI0024344E19|nr:succinylglutamate desuccinylase/aspartoacylase family protein [Olleya sp. YS]WGD35826.1 succinylglutamate desuccinylase/aspartoacylase family protein [Olleya sp. YS]
MIEVYSKALHKKRMVDRIIYQSQPIKQGPTLVFFAGIHGNETAGVFALKDTLNDTNLQGLKGTIYAISGNLKALNINQRFLDEDLNRVWTKPQLEALQLKINYNAEEEEQQQLLQLLENIICQHSGPFYFIDLHTTSSKTLPFITINDALINRKFSKQFPVPIVLGIEEYLNGPLLSYINQLGYVSLGFESGQHNDKDAVLNAIAFIKLSLVFSGILKQENIPDFDKQFGQLVSQSKGISDVFEVVCLHHIKKDEAFTMKPNFTSFQPIKKGTVLATSNNQSVISKHNARLFMPLYQAQGEEGFFIIKTIQPFFLKLSAVLRHLKIDGVLVLLPGVTWQDKSKEVLKVNLKIAKFLATSIFHLLGYRSKKISDNYLLLYNRERVSKTESYKNETWYKKTSSKR